ncbi:MAG: stage 0 sporulation family protein [Oscillospiraceae bacterium]
MAKVIGVRFRDAGKAYYFDPNECDIKKGDWAVVETTRGVECGLVTIGITEVVEEKIVRPLKSVIRKAGAADIELITLNREKEKEAFSVCQKKIVQHELEMKLIDVEYTFDGQKILFYFTADGRIDFRDLVKDLAGIFRTRIELRQIGVRDESKLLGGIGICGKPFCCSTFLFDFQPVSIRMAKEQGKSLNPTKISGTCGRLMCCLKYEQAVYDELIKLIPRNGSIVKTKDGVGVVIEGNTLAGTIKVRLQDNQDSMPKVYVGADVEVLERAVRQKKDDSAAPPKERQDKHRPKNDAKQ